MHGRLQEDVAWTRLQDMQREMENRRLFGEGREPVTIRIVRSLGGLFGRAAGSAFRRARHPRPATPFEACDAVRDVA